MALGVKSNAVVDKSGNQLFLLQLVASGNTWTTATLTIDTYLFNLGLLASSSVAQTSNKQEFESEDGEVVTTSFTYSKMTTGQLMQTDADLINLLGDTVKNKVFLEGKYTGVVNGNHQWHFKVARVTPQFSVARPGGTNSMPYESTAIKLNAALSFSAATMASIGNLLTLSNYVTTTMTISTSKGFQVEEFAA